MCFGLLECKKKPPTTGSIPTQVPSCQVTSYHPGKVSNAAVEMSNLAASVDVSGTFGLPKAEGWLRSWNKNVAKNWAIVLRQYLWILHHDLQHVVVDFFRDVATQVEEHGNVVFAGETTGTKRVTSPLASCCQPGLALPLERVRQLLHKGMLVGGELEKRAVCSPLWPTLQSLS